MSLCRFWTETDKLLLPLSLKQILEISMLFRMEKGKWEWFAEIALKFDILLESGSACHCHNV